MKKAIKIFFVLFFMMLLLAAAAYVFKTFSSETKDMQSQEQFGSAIAEEYLINIAQIQQNETVPDSTEPDLPSDLEYEDNEIYSYYDESYAHGKVDCVIEIPAIDLRQSVFTGTPAQIEHDLRRWLSVTARADYILGHTHYCIYMHNPRNKSIQISKAQETLIPNDYIVITKGQHVHLYQIVNVFAEWRNKCTSMYVDNMATDAKKLYLFTCGRGEWQGRNLVVDGTLYATYSLNDWTANKDLYIQEYKNSVNSAQTTVPQQPKPIKMEVKSLNNNVLEISLIGPQYEKIKNCTIGICDADGYLMENGELVYNAEAIQTQELPDGEYFIGIYNNQTDFADPIPYKVTISKQQKEQIIMPVDKIVEKEETQTQNMKYIALVALSISMIMGIMIIIKIIKE